MMKHHRTTSSLIILVLAIGVLFGGSGQVYAGGEGWYMPDDISVGYGAEIDYLFDLILWLTGATFVVTELILLYTILRFRYQEGHKSDHVHSHHHLELGWTVATGLILFVVAVSQTGIWADVKMEMPARDSGDTVEVRVFARQFEWHFRQKGEDDQFDTADDIITINVLTVPINKNVIIDMRSLDVLHSLFMPHLRFKQDLVPGMNIEGWFKANKTTRVARIERNEPKFDYEIACAELCGIGHHTMRARIEIIDEGEYETWVAQESAAARDFEPNEIWKSWESSIQMLPPKKIHHNGDEE